MGRMRNLWVLLVLVLFSVSIHDFHVSADVIPSENECRPYIEKAIHELKNVDATVTEDDKESIEENIESVNSIENEAAPESGTESVEDNAEKSLEEEANDENKSDDGTASQENQTEENASVDDATKEDEAGDDSNPEDDSKEQNESTDEAATDDKSAEQDDNATNESVDEKADGDGESNEQDGDADSKEGDSKEQQDADGDSKEANGADGDSKEGDSKEQVEGEAQDDDDNDSKESAADDGVDSKENDNEDDANKSAQTEEKEEQDSTEPVDENESEQANDGSTEESTEKDGEKADTDSVEEGENQTAENEADSKEDEQNNEGDADSKEASTENDSKDDDSEQANDEESAEEKVRAKRSLPDEAENNESDEQQESAQNDDNESQENANESQENTAESQDEEKESQENADDSKEGGEDQSDEEEEEQQEQPEEDLTMEFEIPKNLRPRGHVSDLLGLDAESSIKENALKRTGDVVLKELKKVFDNAIHPLETMYKYRDLSNRHFGDPEIFSKPLVLFMGPWSGGKSTILNYLTDNEYTPNSIRSGAEPSPAYFNILMHGDEPEVLDGTQLAADWTFSGLQKFGQGLMDRLRGQKLPSKLLERVNIVEIPGILEVRKQVSRYFPFNDACQWFIDRADIIFLVYDPSKLDVGPETEAILDQLKGREYQTRILLNKADQVKPEELLRVQGALIWNISPLMSSAQPPVMYTVSLWSHPFENGAPIRLLQAQERAFLTDLREAIDRRIENKIASARRFAVRIRNHAKMVDCYLTTYYNQKGLFSNKKNTADKIIEHPQNYNIYEGLSTLTNISRYDLPDPEVYLDFFRLNPLYEFKKLSETCTYFKGCPINKLDIAIAYDLPELVGKYKKLQETNFIQMRKEYDDNCNQTEPELPVKIINSR